MATYLPKSAAVMLAAFTMNGIAVPAWAGHNEPVYAQPAYDGVQYDYAKVLDVQAVTERVQIPQNRRVCRTEPVPRRVAERRSPAPIILSAILGGVIGHELTEGHGHRRGYDRGYGRGYGRGHGHNGAVGTLAGAAIGGVIASSVQKSRYPARYTTENVEVCNTETTYREEQRVVEWDVTWKYRGKIYHSRLDAPPGDRIKVQVSVNPVSS